MGHRLPTILGKAIDDVVKTLSDEYDEERIVDLTSCIERMEDLMEDLQGNAKLRPIVDDGEGDIPLWNKEIARVSSCAGGRFRVAPLTHLYARSSSAARTL